MTARKSGGGDGAGLNVFIAVKYANIVCDGTVAVQFWLRELRWSREVCWKIRAIRVWQTCARSACERITNIRVKTVAVRAKKSTPKSARSTKKPADEKPGVRAAATKKTGVMKKSKAGPAKKKSTKGKKASPKRASTKAVKPKVTRAVIQSIFDRFAEVDPEPKGELEHVNVYTLLVAVVLSAQATDAGVNRATRGLFAVADTPEKMLALGEDKVRAYIQTIGLYRNKAKNVILLSERLVQEFDSEVPRDRDLLETLPGVGRKTANVVMNVAFGMPTMAVDTHVFRLANRLGLAPGKTPLEVEDGLLRVVPEEHGVHAHHWLILHGRYICKARKPECYRCFMQDLCIFKDKTPVPG